jgi:hypothetical protein
MTTLPATSNHASWSEQVEFLDLETSEAMNLSLAQDIVVTIANDHCGRQLQASLIGGGIVMADDFLSVTVSFTRSQMQTLMPLTYKIGARIVFTDDLDEQQVLLGYLPIREGL